MKGRKGVAILAAMSVFVMALLFYQLDMPSYFTSTCTDTHSYVYELASRASLDRYIVLALVDASFVDMAINLYETSFRRNSIDNFLFVGVGRQACELINASMPSNPLPCYHYVDDKAADTASVYLSSDFIRKMNIRTDMIIEALNAGFTVVHTDLDVVFFSNPLPHIKEVMTKADIATLWDKSAYNAGFVVVRPTWYGRRVYELMRQKTKSSKTLDDQTALNSAIADTNRRYQRKGFVATKLDSTRYVCGVDYFESSVDRWPSGLSAAVVDEPLQSECRNDAAFCPMVVHNNWIVSREAKVYRFKEHLMWMYDKDGYFSSPSTQYIAYENPYGSWLTQNTSVDVQLAHLRTALAIASVLDRILILPRFHCLTKSTKSVFDCPFNSLVRMTMFDAGFGSRYRESNFLRHPLVPNTVRHDVSTRYIFQTSTTRTTDAVTSDHTNTTVVIVRNNTVTDDELTHLFGTNRHRVLLLASLEHVHVTFQSTARQTSFDNTVRESLKRSNYRQYGSV